MIIQRTTAVVMLTYYNRPYDSSDHRIQFKNEYILFLDYQTFIFNITWNHVPVLVFIVSCSSVYKIARTGL